MGHTFEVMDIEIKPKDIKIEFLENKTGLPDSKVIEINKIKLNKMSSKRKGDRIMDRLEMLPNNHKYVKYKKQKTKVFE